MLHRMHEFFGEFAVSDKDHTDHAGIALRIEFPTIALTPVVW
jgi:hypothetical protein